MVSFEERGSIYDFFFFFLHSGFLVEVFDGC